MDKPNDEFLQELDCPSTDSDTIVQCTRDAARFVFVSSHFVCVTAIENRSEFNQVIIFYF